MNPLKAIKTSLESLISANPDLNMGNVYYGQCSANKLDTWNYFVCRRKVSRFAKNNLDLQHQYQVVVVMEDCLPEGLVEKIVESVESNSDVTLRHTQDDIPYSYVLKGQTGLVVEFATLTFYRPAKRA